jgi:phage terminase Nu1 subunit (DNA packaging protein)
MGEIVNRNQLAEIFGVSHTTISDWINQGLPAQCRGRKGASLQIDSEQAIRYVERYIERETAGLRAQLRPHGTVEKASEFARAEDFKRGANEMMKLIKSGDAAIASRLALELAAETRPAVVRAKIFAALRENRAAAAARLEHWAAGSDNHLAGLPTAVRGLK